MAMWLRTLLVCAVCAVGLCSAPPGTPPPSSTLLRPAYHFLPSIAVENWINDPNGLFFDTETRLFHLFYQYRTPRVWGHAVSRNLVDFDELPVALTYDVWETNVSGSYPTHRVGGKNYSIPPGVYSGSCS